MYNKSAGPTTDSQARANRLLPGLESHRVLAYFIFGEANQGLSTTLRHDTTAAVGKAGRDFYLIEVPVVAGIKKAITPGSKINSEPGKAAFFRVGRHCHCDRIGGIVPPVDAIVKADTGVGAIFKTHRTQRVAALSEIIAAGAQGNFEGSYFRNFHFLFPFTACKEQSGKHQPDQSRECDQFLDRLHKTNFDG
jgi:hypothetical protein